jgi:hypothetical protein
MANNTYLKEFLMALRLLFAVLMLIGPMPFRVCNCAAANQPAIAYLEPHTHPEVETPSCKCRSKSQITPLESQTLQQQAESEPQFLDNEPCQKPLPHDRECPAVNCSPIVAPAIQSAVPELPSALSITCLFGDEFISPEPARISFPPLLSQHDLAIPLYLVFLTLLI